MIEIQEAFTHFFNRFKGGERGLGGLGGGETARGRQHGVSVRVCDGD